jgi:hypothetical protein
MPHFQLVTVEGEALGPVELGRRVGCAQAGTKSGTKFRGGRNPTQ